MKTKSFKIHPYFLSGLCILLASVALAGCKSGKDKNLDTDLADTPTEPADNQGLPGANMEDLFFEKVGNLNPIYFAYDSESLDAAALAEVKAAADLFKTEPNAIVQVAGHCDERGTQEYNLALGERRAQSVRDHLRQLGISGDRIVTISYGEESPAMSGSNESSWSKNRRCEFSRARSQ